MRVELTPWSDGKVGLSIGASEDELRTLIARLQKILADPEQHFHISHIGGTDCGVGDIEVYFEHRAKMSNMRVSSAALGPVQRSGEQ